MCIKMYFSILLRFVHEILHKYVKNIEINTKFKRTIPL